MAQFQLMVQVPLQLMAQVPEAMPQPVNKAQLL